MKKANTRARIGYKIYKNNDYVDVSVFLGDMDQFAKLKLPVCQEGKLLGQAAFGTVADLMISIGSFRWKPLDKL